MNPKNQIDLGHGSVADRTPWETFLRLLAQEFPDPFGDLDGEEQWFREQIIATATAGRSVHWGWRDYVSQQEILALKRCDAVLEECNIRPAARSVPAAPLPRGALPPRGHVRWALRSRGDHGPMGCLPIGTGRCSSLARYRRRDGETRGHLPLMPKGRRDVEA